MPDPVRRIVTGHNMEGKAVVLMDGQPSRVNHNYSGRTSTLFWVTDRTPADNLDDADAGDREIGIPPPVGGSVFRIVDYPPDDTPEPDSDDAPPPMPGHEAVHRPGDARHFGMHRTDTIDYAIVMSGEIDLLLDEDEVHLQAGDVIVQRGTIHAWANRGAETCRIAFILIDAEAAVSGGNE